MLNRISKTILILTICLGISIPTNAAVSVSDGSAFVTKAEFAADLNNLSNRMAQLENSLDAKIDSLVSSYLTRNGIWNGAKQDTGVDYTWYGKDNFYTVSQTQETLYIHNGNTWQPNNWNVLTITPKYDVKLLTTYPLTKTGLMRFECDITTMSGSPIWAFREVPWADWMSTFYQECGLIVSQTSSLPTDFDYGSNRLYCFTVDNMLVMNKSFASYTANSNNQTAYAFRFSSRTFHQQWYAFVNKGDYLWTYYYFKADSGNGIYVRFDTIESYEQFYLKPTLLSIY